MSWVLEWIIRLYLLYFLVAIGLLFFLLAVYKFSPTGSKINYKALVLIVATTYANVGGLFMFVYLLRPRHYQNARFACGLIRMLSSITGFSWEIRGVNIAAKDRGAVVCCNHQSEVDLFANASFTGVYKKVSFVAKKEMFYAFPFGPAGWLCNMTFIDRSNARSSYETLLRMKDILISKRLKMFFFPEGTRNTEDGFLPFKKGAFLVAIQAQVPIIPMVIAPYHFIDRKRGVFLHEKKHSIVSILEPVSTKGLTDEDVDTLKDKVYRLMLAEYEKLSIEVGIKSKDKEWLTRSRPRVILTN